MRATLRASSSISTEPCWSGSDGALTWARSCLDPAWPLDLKWTLLAMAARRTWPRMAGTAGCAPAARRREGARPQPCFGHIERLRRLQLFEQAAISLIRRGVSRLVPCAAMRWKAQPAKPMSPSRSPPGYVKRALNRAYKGIPAAAMLLAGAAVLAGCSATTVADHVPTAIGGLPEGAPQRSADPPAYPAVHDMPPKRNSGCSARMSRRSSKPTWLRPAIASKNRPPSLLAAPTTHDTRPTAG